jgi:hypothetical protein
MKKLIIAIVVVLIGATNLSAQATETGYVTVQWNTCDPCCTPMQYFAAYSVMRISDNQEVASGWTIVSDQVLSHLFEFLFPCASEGEEFKVFARVVAGCDLGGVNPTICCHGKNPGEVTDCEELMGGLFSIDVDL